MENAVRSHPIRMRQFVWMLSTVWTFGAACQPAPSPERLNAPLAIPVVVPEVLPDTPAPLAPAHDTLAWRQAYAALKAEIAQNRAGFQQAYARGDSAARDSVLQAAASYLLKVIPERLLPFWYGTPWDFNGYSNRPREGIIACGYFVSTPLKHIGWPINRYRVAQKDATSIIKTLCGPSSTLRTASAVLDLLSPAGDKLYVVGLSNHVGFLWVRDSEVFFIHSSYYDPVAVVQEVAAESPAFLASDVYVVGEVLGEKGMLNAWIK